MKVHASARLTLSYCKEARMCDVARCKRHPILSYAAFGKRTKDVSVCQYHWEKHCNDADKFDIRLHFYPKEKR